MNDLHYRTIPQGADPWSLAGKGKCRMEVCQGAEGGEMLTKRQTEQDHIEPNTMENAQVKLLLHGEPVVVGGSNRVVWQGWTWTDQQVAYWQGENFRPPWGCLRFLDVAVDPEQPFLIFPSRTSQAGTLQLAHILCPVSLGQACRPRTSIFR